MCNLKIKLFTVYFPITRDVTKMLTRNMQWVIKKVQNYITNKLEFVIWI